MIDPIHMTQYGKTETQLEETLLFACCVAGKNAISTAKALERFLLAGHKVVYDGWTKRRKFRPFEMLRQLFDAIEVDGVASMLKVCGIGCFNNRARTFHEIVTRTPKFNLKTCTPQDLEEVWGIAEKTSRFFILHTRPDVRYAALDTHPQAHDRQGLRLPQGSAQGQTIPGA